MVKETFQMQYCTTQRSSRKLSGIHVKWFMLILVPELP